MACVDCRSRPFFTVSVRLFCSPPLSCSASSCYFLFELQFRPDCSKCAWSICQCPTCSVVCLLSWKPERQRHFIFFTLFCSLTAGKARVLKLQQSCGLGLIRRAAAVSFVASRPCWRVVLELWSGVGTSDVGSVWHFKNTDRMAVALPVPRGQLVFENRVETETPVVQNGLVKNHPFNHAVRKYSTLIHVYHKLW